MYQASAAFHTAVATGAPQKALLIFADTIFTDADLDIEAGIELDDYFNTEEDIAIGQALSNELRFTLFNDDQLLNDYAFGDFTATIGARVSTGTYSDSAQVIAYDGNTVWRGRNTSPYLTRNGSAVSSQPGWPVRCIAIYDDTVYVFGTSGRYKAYTNGGSEKSVTVNAFMRAKSAQLHGEGINFQTAARSLKIWKNKVTETYEFVPLGKFIAKRPNVPDTDQINFVCNDFMTKFDVDMPSAAELGITYPTTISNLFVKMCEYADVLYASSTFINSTAVITEAPKAFENATMRQVMQWIAEAGAANLRFNRDGLLTFDWLKSTSQVYGENDYEEFRQYWYETTQVSKLYNRDTESGTDKTVGTGEIGYLIQDNPLLKGVT